MQRISYNFTSNLGAMRYIIEIGGFNINQWQASSKFDGYLSPSVDAVLGAVAAILCPSRCAVRSLPYILPTNF